MAVEKIVGESIRRECQAFNRKVPEVIVIANESNPALAAQVLRVGTFSYCYKSDPAAEDSGLEERCIIGLVAILAETLAIIHKL